VIWNYCILLFNICTHGLPRATSIKFAYADDLAIMHSAPKWQTLEATLNQDMATLFTFHIFTEVKPKAQYHWNSDNSFPSLQQGSTTWTKHRRRRKDLALCSGPTYLGIKLDRSLTYRQNLESLKKKLTARVGLLRRLAGSKCEVLTPKHCVRPLLLWSFLLLSIQPLSGAAASTLVSLTSPYTIPCD